MQRQSSTEFREPEMEQGAEWELRLAWEVEGRRRTVVCRHRRDLDFIVR